MFKWFNLNKFLDTYQEWHALVVGFCEVICPWPAQHKPSPENEGDIANEYHYYMWGRALGILGWLAICSFIKFMFF